MDSEQSVKVTDLEVAGTKIPVFIRIWSTSYSFYAVVNKTEIFANDLEGLLKKLRAVNKVRRKPLDIRVWYEMNLSRKTTLVPAVITNRNLQNNNLMVRICVPGRKPEPTQVETYRRGFFSDKMPVEARKRYEEVCEMISQLEAEKRELIDRHGVDAAKLVGEAMTKLEKEEGD